jgi:hypothetical protein
MTPIRITLALIVAISLAPPNARASIFTLIKPAPAASGVYAPTNPPPFFHWDLREFPACQVPYRVNNAGAALLGYAATAAGVANAFAQWEAVEPALIRFVDNGAGVGTAVRAAANDNENCIFWDINLCSGDPWDPGLRGGAIGITCINGSTAIPASATGIINNCDIVFDDQQFDWSNGTQSAPALVPPGGDDFAAIQTLVGGNRRIVIADGGNGRCESQRACNDVQVVAPGPCAVGAVLITPLAAAVAPPALPTPLAGSTANLSGTMDVWNIAAHEIGHFCGLGENNAAVSGFGQSETLGDGPYNIPAGRTLTFTINGNLVTVALTAGAARTGAQVAADINAAIAAQQAGQANATAGPSGGVVLQGTALGADILRITGGTGAGILGFPTGESGAATMNQSPQGLVRLDQRTLARPDMDGLNFLYTWDLGDAIDPGNNRYQTLVHGTVNSRVLSGIQLMTPLAGAAHLFGTPSSGFRWEWLGPKEDGSNGECDAFVADLDQFDDGMGFAGGRLRAGQNNLVTVLVNANNPGGRYFNIGNSRLYFNGYFDWNLNKQFEPGEREIFWNGVPGATNAASPNFVPGSSNLASNPMVLVFNVFVSGGIAVTDSLWVRGRLDYGEDEGRANNINGDLAPAERVAQFGEVEDYRVKSSPIELRLACPPDQSGDYNNPVTLHYCIENLTDAPLLTDYKVLDDLNWMVPPGPLTGQVELAPFGTYCFDVTVRPDINCDFPDQDEICLIAGANGGSSHPDTCCTHVDCTQPTPTLISRFEGRAGLRNVDLTFALSEQSLSAAVNLYRAPEGGAEVRINGTPIALDGETAYRFSDVGLTPGTSYRYEIGLVDHLGAERRAGSIFVSTLRAEFALGRPLPNPTADGFAIDLVTPRDGPARLRLYDVAGRVVRTLFEGPLAIGEHTFTWDGRHDSGAQAGSGIYFVIFEAAGRRATERVVVVQ